MKDKGTILTQMTSEKILEHEESFHRTLKAIDRYGLYEMNIVFAHIPHLFPTMDSFVPLGPDTW